MAQRTDLDRFWAKVDKTAECWSWIGYIGEHGYGRVSFRGRKLQAHVAVYELLVGPVPDGLELDHLCHNRDLSCKGGRSCLHRRCVNPEHLEPVPSRQNALSGRGPSAVNARKTHCPQGHPYDEANTYVGTSGARYCRACYATRGITLGLATSANARKTHCKHGHLFDEANTRYTTRGRTCRSCDNERGRRKRARG